MYRNTFVAALVAVSLVGVPTIAMAAQVKSASISKLSVRSAPAVRQAISVTQESKLRGAGVIISLVVVAGVITAIVIATGGKDKSSSPS